MVNFRSGSLQWAAGVFCAVIGALILIAPEQFGAASFNALRPNLLFWGSAFLCAGAALVITVALAMHRLVTILAFVLAGGVLLWLAAGFFTTAAVIGVVIYGSLGLACLGGAFLSHRAHTWMAGGDLLVLAIALSAVLLGGILVFLPDELPAATYAAIGPIRTPMGGLFIAGGIALLYSQLLPVPRAIVWGAHLLVAALYLRFAFLPRGSWTGYAYFGGFGLIIGLQPWLAPRLQNVETASLRMRLALTLVIAVSLPLVIAVAATTAQAERIMVEQALVEQEVRAAAESQSLHDSVQQYYNAVAVVAKRLDVGALTPDQQRTALRTLVGTGIFAFDTYDVRGQPIARSDDLALAPLPAGLLSDVLRTGAPSVLGTVSPQLQRPEFVFAAPVLSPDGVSRGFIAAEIEATQVSTALAHLDPGRRTGATVFLISGDGHVLAHPDAAITAAQTDLSQHPAARAVLGATGSGVLRYRIASGDQLAGFARVPDLGWGIIVERPLADVLAGTLAERDGTFGLLLFAVAVAAAVGSFVAARLSAPLRTLESAVNQLAEGDATAPLPRSNIGEVKRLTVLFGQMRNRLLTRTDERERALTELRESEKRYRELFENAHDMIYTNDMLGNFTSMNAAGEAILGYTQAELLRMKTTDFWASESKQRTRAVGQQLISGEPAPTFRVEMVARDGRMVPLEISARLIVQEDRPVGFQGIARDITERLRAEQVQANLAAIVESSDDAIIGKTLEGIITSWNAGAERIYGYATGEIVGRSIRMLTLPDRPDELPSILERLRRGESIDHYETVRLRKDGRRINVSLTMSSVRSSAGEITGASVIARDITERVQAENEIRRLNADLERRVADRTAQLEAANKELEAFSYSVSHDLRAPLRHISGFVSLLERNVGAAVDEKGRHYFKVISESAREMGQLIDDLLVFSRMGRGELHQAPVNLDSLVRTVIQDLHLETEGRTIAWEIASLPQIEGDSAMLKQVMANLIGNAVKYTRTREQACIRVGASQSDQETVVCVQDNGVGFDMHYVDKLFGVFQRLHDGSEFEGTGIGLANVRRIIHRHGGRTWAEGAPGAGATFYFSLPRRWEN